MLTLSTYLNRINAFQLKLKPLAFVVAVIKKYSDDDAGRKAALLTYYGFLSLFPFLLILTTICDIIVGTNSHIKATILSSLTSYFPLLGNQLTESVHRVKATGIALVTGTLFLFYGTRGVANIFRSSMQDLWYIPKDRREKFPDSLFKSLTIIIIGGLGFMTSALVAGSAASLTRGLTYRIISILISAVLLFCLMNFLMIYSLPKKIKLKEIWLGAAVATIGLLILQALGGIILDHELRRLSALYSYFAVTLGLIFWIYLQSQIIFYSVEISVVSSLKLWPRSLDSKKQTVADEKITKHLVHELEDR